MDRKEIAEQSDEPQGGPYAWYTLAILILAYAVSFLDRQALTLLVDPIRGSLHISDTELSLLHGIAFSLFYTVMGIPIGRMVDTRRRVGIVSAGIAVWSAMTAVCGLAQNFVQMFLARIGVGVGEAALSPAAYSLMADRMSLRQLPLALNIYMGAAHLGSGLAIMIGGSLIGLMSAAYIPGLGTLEPWRMVFIVIGLPGILLALLVLSLREPRRHGAGDAPHPSLSDVARHMRGNGAAYSRVILGYALSGILWNGSLAWLPTYFMRIHHWTPAEVGWRYGLVVMLAGIAGVLSGGVLTTRLRAAGHEDANLRIGLISLTLAAPTGIWAVLQGSEWMALAGVAAFLFVCAFPYGPAAAALQEITPNRMRGQVSAVFLFFLNLLGLGVGATLVAVFTDHVFHSDMAIHRSLATMLALCAPIAWAMLWWARTPYKAALVRRHRVVAG